MPLLEDLTAGEKTVLDITTKYVKEANIEFYYSKWYATPRPPTTGSRRC